MTLKEILINKSFDFFSTPPLRTVAFEEFKQERGSEIHRILLENKGKSIKCYLLFRCCNIEAFCFELLSF